MVRLLLDQFRDALHRQEDTAGLWQLWHGFESTSRDTAHFGLGGTLSRFFAISLAVALFGGPASAADLSYKAPVKAEPAAAPVFSWTGCYVGGHVGGGWGTRDIFGPSGFILPPIDPFFAFRNGTPFGVNSLNEHVSASGLLGGAQAGCKYQFAQNLVIGFEGEHSWAQLTGDRQVSLTPVPFFSTVTVPANLHVQTDWIASATAMLGYSLNGLLLYGKGGAAWTQNRYGIGIGTPEDPDLPQASFVAQERRSGWTVGAGVEYPFANHFSTRLEYDYYDFGSRSVLFADQLSPSVGRVDVRQRVHAVKLGLNYFLWNAPPLPVSGGAAAPWMSWNETFSTEARYFSWEGTRGTPTNAVAPNGEMALGTRGGGIELYTPYAAQLVGQSNDLKVEMLMRGGWVSARQSTPGLTGAVATATDTVTSGTITYLGLRGLQPFASLELNLPTGLAALTATQVNARMDPDLVDISTFGEGLNIGPTVGVNIPLAEAWLLTTSAGYTRRGTYNTEGPLTPPGGGAAPQSTKIEPGDALTLTAVLGYQSGPFSARVTGTFTENGTTQEDGTLFIKPGQRSLIAGTASYNWPGDHSGTTTVNASAAHSNRNVVLFQCLMGCPIGLVLEPFNTNSNLYQAGLQHLFNFNQFAIGPAATFLFRDNNGYEPTTLQFVPAKQRWSAGVLAQYAPTNAFSFNARVDRIWTQENLTPALPNGEMFSVLAGSTLTSFMVPTISSTGWLFTVGTTANF
jgi:opacity protein-like surface antigen